MADQKSRTEIEQIGEFGLIDRISRQFISQNGSTLKGIDDDAAVMNYQDNQLTLVTSDMLLEGVHFDLSYAPIMHLGYKSIAVNISDIAAMNGTPEQVTVNLALSNRFSVQAVDAFYQGVKAACDDYRVDLVGGDTTSSRSGLVISVTAMGKVHEKSLVYRNGAKKGDILCTTGDLGAAYLGLQILEREKQVYLANPEMQPQLDKYEYIVGRQLKPRARMDIIYDLSDYNVVPTAMIDISDGLASELFHIATQSKLGVQIYEDKLPIDQRSLETAVELNLNPVTCMLNGGEDYELLFSIEQDDYKKIENHPDIHFIGYLHEKENGMNLVTKNEQLVSIQAQGWQHFHS